MCTSFKGSCKTFVLRNTIICCQVSQMAGYCVQKPETRVSNDLKMFLLYYGSQQYWFEQWLRITSQNSVKKSPYEQWLKDTKKN